MRVTVCPSDRQGVGYYRTGFPAMTLMDQGADIDFQFLPGLPLNVSTITGQPVGLADDFDCDVLVLQRPTADWKLVALHDAQKRGITVVVELDDDFHSLHHAQLRQMGASSGHFRNLGECCKHADLVTVSTQALAERYAPHGRVAVIPNYVSAKWLHVNAEPNATPVVGWTGTVATHRDDLQATHGGAAMATEQHGATFRVIGRPELAKENLGLSNEPENTPWQTMGDYPYEVAKLDIGIAPLADNAFNRAKSWLKPLEYAALGVPCVMSPTTEYQRIHDEYGIGVLAGWRSREWKRETLRLLTDHDYRNQLSEQGRQAVRDHLTMEANAWRWQDAWASALVAA